MKKGDYFRDNIALGLIFVFLANIIGSMPAQAQMTLPAPGELIAQSPTYQPAVLKGIKLDAQDPFRFHFFVDAGHRYCAVKSNKSTSTTYNNKSSMAKKMGNTWWTRFNTSSTNKS